MGPFYVKTEDFVFKKLLFVVMPVVIFGAAVLDAASAREARAIKRAERVAAAVQSTEDIARKRRIKKRAVSAPDVLAATLPVEAPEIAVPSPSTADFSRGWLSTTGEPEQMRMYRPPAFGMTDDGRLDYWSLAGVDFSSVRSNILRFVPGDPSYEPMADDEATRIADIKRKIIFDLDPSNLLTKEEINGLLTTCARAIDAGSFFYPAQNAAGKYKISFEHVRLVYIELVAPTMHFDRLPSHYEEHPEKAFQFYRRCADFRFQDKCIFLRPIRRDEVNIIPCFGW